MTNNDKALDLFNRIIDLIRVCKVETWARNVFDEDVETIRQALTPQSSADTPKPNTPTRAEALAVFKKCKRIHQPVAHDTLVYEFSANSEQMIISALTAPIEKVDGWLPIESAPEGKDILVYCQETGECFVVFWALQVDTRKGDWVIARANDGTCFICKNPTHWQPLPAPPAARLQLQRQGD